jgi:hypothetical protein
MDLLHVDERHPTAGRRDDRRQVAERHATCPRDRGASVAAEPEAAFVARQHDEIASVSANAMPALVDRTSDKERSGYPAAYRPQVARRRGPGAAARTASNGWWPEPLRE